MPEIILEIYHASDYKLKETKSLCKVKDGDGALKYYYNVCRINFPVKMKENYFLVNQGEYIYKYKLK